MPLPNDTILINLGAGFVIEFDWRDITGAVLNLTGYSAQLFDVHADLAGHLTATLITPAVGRTRLSLVWADTIPPGRVAYFRIRMLPPSGPVLLATPQIWLDVR